MDDDLGPTAEMNAAQRKSSNPKSGWAVLKFGGTSVASAASWATIRDVVRDRLDAGMRPLVVHSAIAGLVTASRAHEKAMPTILMDRRTV